MLAYLIDWSKLEKVSQPKGTRGVCEGCVFDDLPCGCGLVGLTELCGAEEFIFIKKEQS